MINGSAEHVRMEIEWYEGGAYGRPLPEFEEYDSLLIVEEDLLDKKPLFSLAEVQTSDHLEPVFITDEGDLVTWQDIAWYTRADWSLPKVSDRQPPEANL